VLAYAFPGQGSQYSGMGRLLLETYPEAERTLRLADEVAGFPISRLLLDASEEELRRTENTQPAIFLYSAALYDALGETSPPEVVFGHSLGEFSALYAAGVFDFATALHLVLKRGEIMGRAAGGGMVAIVGEGALKWARRVIEEGKHSTLVIANYNSPKQVVISGAKEEIDRALKDLREITRSEGIRLRLVPLKVGAAFHSPMMEEAAREFKEVLERVKFNDPKVPVIMNSTGRVARTAREVREALHVQLRSPVRFTDMIDEALSLGVDTVWEVGPGRVLCGLIRQTTDAISCEPKDPKYARVE